MKTQIQLIGLLASMTGSSCQGLSNIPTYFNTPFAPRQFEEVIEHLPATYLLGGIQCQISGNQRYLNITRKNDSDTKTILIQIPKKKKKKFRYGSSTATRVQQLKAKIISNESMAIFVSSVQSVFGVSSLPHSYEHFLYLVIDSKGALLFAHALIDKLVTINKFGYPLGRVGMNQIQCGDPKYMRHFLGSDHMEHYKYPKRHIGEIFAMAAPTRRSYNQIVKLCFEKGLQLPSLVQWDFIQGIQSQSPYWAWDPRHKQPSTYRGAHSIVPSKRSEKVWYEKSDDYIKPFNYLCM